MVRYRLPTGIQWDYGTLLSYTPFNIFDIDDRKEAILLFFFFFLGRGNMFPSDVGRNINLILLSKEGKATWV